MRLEVVGALLSVLPPETKALFSVLKALFAVLKALFPERRFLVGGTLLEGAN